MMPRQEPIVTWLKPMARLQIQRVSHRKPRETGTPYLSGTIWGNTES